MKSLFSINHDFLRLVDDIIENGGELTPELETRLAISKEELSLKSVNYFHVIKQIESEYDLLDNEIKRLQSLKKARKNSVDRLKENLINTMELHEINKLETETLKISIRTNKSIEVTDIEKLPFNCVEIEKNPLKTEIKKLIEAGQEIKGAYQKENKSLDFK